MRGWPRGSLCNAWCEDVVDMLSRNPPEKVTFMERRNRVIMLFTSGQIPMDYSPDPQGPLGLLLPLHVIKLSTIVDVAKPGCYCGQASRLAVQASGYMLRR